MIKHIFYFLVFAVSIVCFHDLEAKDKIRFRQFWLPEGQSNNRVLAINQDKNGFLWVITEKGLNRYDGYEVKTYRKDFNFLLDDDLFIKSSLFINSKNTVWTISASLVPEYFDQKHEKFIPLNDLNSVTAMSEVADDKMIFGTISGQLFIWNPANETKELILAKTSQEIVKLIQNPYVENEMLVLFKNEVGIINTATKEYNAYISLPKSNPLQLSTAAFAPNGNLWLGTFEHGVFEWNPKQELVPMPVKTGSQLITETILDLHLDSSGRLWIGTYGSGVFLYESSTQALQQFEYSKNSPHSIGASDILCIYQDYSGTIWIGTLGGGLNFYDSFLDKFQLLSNDQIAESIHLENIRSLYLNSDGLLWVGSASNGILSYDFLSQNWARYSSADGNQPRLQENRVLSLAGHDDKLWIGYQTEGLSILNQNDETISHYNEFSTPVLPADQINSIFKDQIDRFWLGTRNQGLLQFDPAKGVIKTFSFDPKKKNSFPDNHITAINQSNNQNLWVATYSKGLIKLNIESGEFQQIPLPDDNSLPDDNLKIAVIYSDKMDRLWVGTGVNGLYVLDTKSENWLKIPELAFFESSHIHGILEDKSGIIWVSSDKGITSISTAADFSLELKHFDNFDKTTGLFTSGASFSDPDYGLFFGGIGHILHFRGEEIYLNQVKPKLALTKIINGNSEILQLPNQTFEADENNLTLHFSSLMFSAPEKNQYKYRLKGHEEEWKIQQGTNWVNYTKLGPGDYEFEVMGSNYDGIWNETPVSFKFQINPPWYQSNLLKIIYFLIFLAFLTFIYRYLKWRWMIKYMLEVKNQEAIRLKEIDQLKSAFFSNISHELRTPLSLIMGPTERLIQDCENPIQKSQLNLIQSNSKKLLALVDKILSIRKITAEKPTLNVQKGNLGLLIQSVLINFYYLSSKKNLVIQSHIPLITEVWFDLDQMERILENLIHFVIDEAEEKSSIIFESKFKNQQVTLALSYTPSHRSKLWKGNGKSPEIELGNQSNDAALKLQLIKKLIDSHYGKLILSSDDATRNDILLEFSVDKYSFHPAQVIDEEEWEVEKTETTELTAKLGDDAPKVLIVEDNQGLRNFLVRELSNTYHIVEASDGKEGIYEAYNHIPDLILSDIMMPEIDGLTLCKELKNNEKTSHIPIILLTAKIEEDTQLLGLELGADDYIQKPFSARQLALRIEKLIELRKKLRIRFSQGTILAPKEIATSSTDEKFLHKIQEIVESDLLDSEFSAEDFSKRLGMSRMQLHRKLTALTGFSTSSFIRDQRLRKAIQKLEKTDETVAEIGYSVGFSSPSYFIKCFKETYQMTPLEYQQKHSR